MARVAQRRGKYVLDYYDQNGKRRWETTSGNKKEAELLLAQRLQEIDRGDFQTRSAIRPPSTSSPKATPRMRG